MKITGFGETISIPIEKTHKQLVQETETHQQRHYSPSFTFITYKLV